ncbi:hypothetical protein BO71DRAFT_476279 [Aspergillus ellipticus CBS 707.79]|uniref:Uncharacterized protein n=1 Tax=Aspergillus ellipticus CBS 707.79 TaxID=1448320 RepID=A0A319DAJ8_9EURO|nr:hypothetical protein BO71DRAFT_476279 [Aspergillus ellipticus CBS 707.79]
MSSLPILLLLPAYTYAYTSFTTNCTLPPHTFNYVSAPNTRGTLTILWTCLFTIISCTWTVQHPDVPWQREHYAPGAKGRVKWEARKYSSMDLWFFATVVAPEVLAKYWRDNLEASTHLEQFTELAKQDGAEWTRTHCFFADMGGFVMRTNVVQRGQMGPGVLPSQSGREKPDNDDSAIRVIEDSTPSPSTLESDSKRLPERDVANEEAGITTEQNVSPQQKSPHNHPAMQR